MWYNWRMKDGIVVVSVVRDLSAYGRLVAENRFLKSGKAEMVMFDNRGDNLPVPVRYNAFLDSRSLDEEAWYVFCHEDFEFLEPIDGVLASLDKGAVYGVVGADAKMRIVGNFINCRRDGSCRTFNECRVIRPVRVSTVDCCCLIAHSSVIRRHCLRFDPKLEWDFYSEDFSAAAAERFGIPTFVVPLLCRHWSYGNAGRRFMDTLALLRGKWRNARSIYATTTMQVFGNARRAFLKRMARRMSAFFWHERFVSRNELKVSCMRIPVCRRRVRLPKLRRFSDNV